MLVKLDLRRTNKKDEQELLFCFFAKYVMVCWVCYGLLYWYKVVDTRAQTIVVYVFRSVKGICFKLRIVFSPEIELQLNLHTEIY